jgi:hypothetical protein
MDESSFIEVFNRLQELAKVNKEEMNMEQLKTNTDLILINVKPICLFSMNMQSAEIS